MSRLNLNTKATVNESKFEDIAEYQEITDSKDIIKLLGDTIILDRYKGDFDYLYQRVVDVAVLCWNNYQNGDKLQHTQIKLKATIDSPMTYIIRLNWLMMSLPFIEPVMEFIDEIDLGSIIVDGHFTVKMRKRMQDNVVSILQHYGITIEEIQELMANLALNLKEELMVFSHADMVVFTAENLFLDHYMNSEIIRDINNTEYPADMLTADIVKENKKKYEMLEKEMLRLGNPYFECNEFTNIIKPKQMEELYINFSQTTDGQKILSVIMNGNGFKKGYDQVPVFYAAAIAARVPDIMNEEFMGSAGYFSRNLMILTNGTISPTVFDCGSRNTLKVTIKEELMDMYEGRYYYPTKHSQILRVFRKDNKDLIGKTLYFRSPCFCNLNEDVCHICYGSAALKVGNLKGGFIYTTETATSRVGQNVLSVKHILKADAEPLIFVGPFDDWFEIESSSVIPKENNDKRFDIYIKTSYQEDISTGFTCYIGKDMIEVGITNYASIHIPDSIIDSAKEVTIDDETYYKISSFKILDKGGVFYNFTPISISSTAVYMNIMKLFENDVTKFATIDDAAERLTELLHKTIPILATHGEIMLSKLIRKPDNKLLRPNFLEEDAPYQILRLKTALQNAEAVTTGLAFEQTRHHILHPIQDERNKINRVGVHGFSDYMFGEENL